MAFLLIALTVDMDIIILGVQNLAFGRPGASTSPFSRAILAARGHLGGPWEQQEEHVGCGTRLLVILK